MEDVLNMVKASLADRSLKTKVADVGEDTGHAFANRTAEDYREGWDDGNDRMVMEDEYEDDGTGAGIEGDLEMGDDE